MSFTEAIKTGFRKYIDFSGRASRSEYWWFILFTVIARILTGFIPGVGFIVSLGLLLPSLSATARRLHDTDRTGWWILLPIGAGVAGIVAGIILVTIDLLLLGAAIAILGPIIGFLALLGFLMQPSDPGANRYGAAPYPPRGTGGYSPIPSDPHPPRPTDTYGASEAAPPPYTPSGRQYCPQCGAEQVSGDARACAVCGAAYSDANAPP